MTVKKTVKTANTNKPIRKVDKRGDRYERFWYTEEQIVQLGLDFKAWCRESSEDLKSRNLVTARFWLNQDIHPNTPATWAKKHPEFKRDYDIGKAYMACKKLEGIYLKELEPKSTTFTIHNLLDSWKDAEKYHAELKNKNDVVASLVGVTFDVPELDDCNKSTEWTARRNALEK